MSQNAKEGDEVPELQGNTTWNAWKAFGTPGDALVAQLKKT